MHKTRQENSCSGSLECIADRNGLGGVGRGQRQGIIFGINGVRVD